jgi:Lamin Tail Domain
LKQIFFSTIRSPFFLAARSTAMRNLRGGFTTLCLPVLLINWQVNHDAATVYASVIISEIASKGSANVCGDGVNDWIELFNSDAQTSFDISGYILHDDKGIQDAANYFTFPHNYEPLRPHEYRLVCTKQQGDNNTDPTTTMLLSPQFSIGGDDTITLVARDGLTILASVGPLPDLYNDFDITYAWDAETGTLSVDSIERPAENQTVWSYMGGYNYYYTSTPTPGLPNVLTQVGETSAQIKQRLAAQNDAGSRFFGMNAQGFPVVAEDDGALDPVLDLHLTMLASDYEYMMANKQFELYLPFQTARLVTPVKPQEEILSITSPGNIRTKGQTTLFFSSCMNTTTGE